MGMTGFEAFEVGSAATLALNGKSIKLTVTWCRPDSVRGGVFHAGFSAAAGSPNLVDEFTAAGLLLKKAARQGV